MGGTADAHGLHGGFYVAAWCPSWVVCVALTPLSRRPSARWQRHLGISIRQTRIYRQRLQTHLAALATPIMDKFATEQLGTVVMTTGLHCTYLLLLVHACVSLYRQNRHRWSPAPRVEACDDKILNMAPDDARGARPNRPDIPSPRETTISPNESPARGKSSTIQMAVPHPDYVPDEQELERRRLGEAQPQVVPTEVILNKFYVARTRADADSGKAIQR
ncbi:hypothetical protein TPAR_07772 [Tolypocladium paradoxum]|uniref:Uncharacterized protein n=1 Tax=Tolypocladium paradoxum TaxID=94208 RepID=A0A2S4KP81_9HYPO|nr:hypothetical protein TPAR_07772 [Tolypocladium paradoxum]